MPDQPPNPASVRSLPGRLLARPLVKAGLYAAGLALLAGAVFVVVRDRETVARALEHARSAPWWKFAILLCAPLLNWLLSTAMFAVLTRRYAPIRFGEMLWLIGASWLLNYLPMRPGLIARVAYLKAVRGVAIRDSAKVGITSAACTIASAGIIAEVALVLQFAGQPRMLTGAAVVVGILCAVGVGYLYLRVRDTHPRWTAYAVGLGLRLLDMLVQALRIYLAFDVLGAPVAASDALLLAGPAQIVSLMPVQIGTVEWTVGLLARQAGDGFTAALLNRAVDMLVALPVGLLSLVWLWRRRSLVRAGLAMAERSDK